VNCWRWVSQRIDRSTQQIWMQISTRREKQTRDCLLLPRRPPDHQSRNAHRQVASRARELIAVVFERLQMNGSALD
jgi:hypothetical protein